MLELRDITAGYGHFTALWDVSLRVDAGEAVAVVGPNGAGKTTLLRVISGLIAPREGSFAFDGVALTGLPAYQIVAHGIAHVPEGRRLFPALTVADNLKMGAFLPAARAHFGESLERVYTLFPVLAERRPSGRAACRAASSRCSPSGGPSCRARRSSCSTSPPWAWPPSWCCGSST